MDAPTDLGPPDPRLLQPAGERRQVTALFYDIVNSTSLLMTLDPEDFGIAQRAIHTAAASVIRRNGGHLDQITGDGGCAFFGYPVAAEDAAECAVNAALEMIEQCRSVPEAAGNDPPIQIRVGVATGTVVVNSATAAGLPANREVVGLAVNLAARLQAFAEPDTTLVSETTYKLTHSAFEYAPSYTIALKGFHAPQQVWRPIGRREAELRFETLRRPDTPFVARARELELARHDWREAQTGAGRVSFLTGEAGIGKSRLVSELLQGAAGDDCDRRIFQCQSRGNRRPFHAIADRLLREIHHSTGQQQLTGAAIRDYLTATAPGVRPESLDVLEHLAENEDETREPIDVPNPDFGEAAVNAICDVLAAWARMRPQLIIVEDFHWADALTKALLTRIAKDVATMRVLVVVTSRDPVEAALSAHPSVIVQDLSRLSPQEVAQLVADIWQPLPVPPDLSGFIDERSEGVPLFVEELTHLIRERFGDQAGIRADWERLLKSEGVVTLNDLLLERIATAEGALRMAQTASVIGREFSYELLADIAQETPADSLDGQLEALIERDVIHPVGEGGMGFFRFRHVLFQDVAYDSLLRSERRELHNRIVAAATRHGGATLSDDIMAWHCEQAGKFMDAAQYAIMAAESCAIRSAAQEAQHLLSSAEAHIAHVDAETMRDDLMLWLLATRGPVEMALFGSGSREARRTYEDAVAICRRKDAATREQWFPLYWGWWMTSPNAESVARSRIVVSDLESTGDAEIRLQALHCSWATHFHAGNHRECLHCIDQGLKLYDAERAVLYRTKYGGHDAKVCALAERGQSLWFCGDKVAAAENVNAALRFAEETEHLGSICHALDVALLFNAFERNTAEVLRLAARMRDLADKHTLPNCEAKSAIFSGWAGALSGDVADGLALFERGLGHQRAIGTEEDLPLYLDMRSAILEHAGRDADALRAIEEALDLADHTSDAVWLPELYRRRAMLGAKCGRPHTLVLKDLDHALSLAEEQGAETPARRARADLDTLQAQRRAQGHR